MNFKDFKKVDVTATHTVFKHPSGHTIHVAHDSLTPEQKKQMREIPMQSAMEKLRERKKAAKKMAEGGQIENEDAFEKLQAEMQAAKEMPMPGEVPMSQMPVQQGKEVGIPDARLLKGTLTDVPAPGAAEEVLAAKAAEPEETLENIELGAPPSEKQAQVPGAPSIGSAMAIEGALQQIQGAKNIAESQKMKSLAETEALGKSLQQMQESLTAAQQQRQQVQANIDRLTKAVEEGTLKPDRVLGSGSSKIMNVIGLVLGGAMQFATLGIVPNIMKQAIDDDIEKQKSELEQRNNLLGYNLKLLGNITDAENVTRMQMATIADLQAKRAALKSADKEAMGRYQIFSGEVQQKLIAPYMQQMEQQASMQQATSQPVSSPTQIVQMIQTRIKSPAQQKEAIKEYGEYKNLMSGIEQVKGIMRAQADLNTLANRLTSPIQTPQRLKTMKAQLFPVIKGIVGEKMTDADVKQMVDPFLVKLTTSPETVNQMTSDLINTIQSRLGPSTPTLELYDIKLPKPIQAKPLPTVRRK